MAAYAAATSLKKTIEHILDSSRISLVAPSSEIIKLVCREMKSLKKTLKRLDSCSKSKSRKRVNALDERIKEAVWNFEDLLESYLSDEILLEIESCGGESDALSFSIDLQALQRDVDSFMDAVKDMEQEYIHELNNLPDVEEDESVSSRNDFDGMNSKMVGLSGVFISAKTYVLRENDENSVQSLVGTAGIGKTTVAKEIFKDPVTLRWFDHRAWVTMGRKSLVNETARDILFQIDPSIDKNIVGDEEISEKLKERLEGKRCLIVLDDVWDTEILDFLEISLPNESNGTIRILLTSRLISVTGNMPDAMGSSCASGMQPMNEEESEELLRQSVFGEKDFPPQLEKAAKKIAKNCEGLPLMIVTVAEHLFKSKNIEPEYWNEVAKKRSSVFMDAYNQISKVLFPSYDCFPQHLKMFYLYMGAFSQEDEIPLPKLINMLTVEGFLEVHAWNYFFDESLYEFGMWSNIVISKEKSIRDWSIKTCRLYSWWWHLFNREASKGKFLRVLIGVDGIEGLQGQRRLCLHNNNLFCFKEVSNSVKFRCALAARSFLCFGPYFKYSVALDVGFKLLWVLDALKVRFYRFPIEILNLVLLQYLALTCNRELPTSISKLFNLQFLIIHPHMRIKSCGAPSYLPVQIWDMQELKHIEILGGNLPNPNCAASLHKLSTYLGVSANNLIGEILQRLPTITKLGIQIELTPHDDDSNSLNCFHHISELQNLETLKCSIMNPEVLHGYVAHLTPLSVFPSTLQKLHLSGFGYPWKYMKVIGSLPNLVVLKLRCYAFQGPKWETKRKSFVNLKFLLIEDTDLVQWKPKHESFSNLRTLRIKHCYKLEELHWPSNYYSGRIELVDCNPLAVTCAKQLKPRHKNNDLEVIVSSEDSEHK